MAATAMAASAGPRLAADKNSVGETAPVPSSLKRKLEGFGTASGQYMKPYPTPEIWHQHFASATDGICNSSTTTFEIEVPERTVARFKDDPFLVTVIFREKNPAFIQASLDTHNAAVTAALAAGNAPPATPDNCRPHRNPHPALRNPAIYVDEYVGGQFAFSKVNVVIDGVKIDNNNMEAEGYHYQAVNRAFATESLRVEKYGRPMRGVAHSGERVVQEAVQATEGRTERAEVRGVALPAAANAGVLLAAQAARAYVPAIPRQAHPRLLEAMEIFSPQDQWVSEPVTFRLGFDGIFPLSSENNALRALTGQRNDTGQLRPLTKINIQVIRRSSKPGDAVERVAVPDVTYFASTDIPDADADGDLTMEVIDFRCAYETSLLSLPAELERLKAVKHPLRYFHDTVEMRTNQLGEDRTFDSQTVLLPQFCRLVYIMFLHETQIMPHCRKHNFLSARHRFPPGLEEIKLDLVGHNGLLFDEGIQGIGGGNGRSSLSLIEHHSNMVRKGLYERPYTHFIPEAGGVGYQQVILLDLLPYMQQLDKGLTSLKVSLKYSTMAAKRWSLQCYCVGQRKYEYLTGKKWTHVDL